MRKIICALIFSGALSAMGAHVVPGVSRELARERKECLDSIKYHLDFHYPGNDNAGFYIEEEILLQYAGGVEDYLQIDFDGNELISCEVNDTVITPEWKAKHILIPKDLLHVGQNVVKIKCLGNDKALNSNPRYMYTLFVPSNAHSAFPCFDQPDLKATFTPSLHIPRNYECMSSMRIESIDDAGSKDTKSVTFKESPLLPTYLMSWVIGDFQKSQVGNMTIMHNETDSLKVAQIPEMCDISSKTIRWLEEYTGIPYPFEKYDFAIIPGFQFGGMEHPGAILYPPETTFLSEKPTPEELLKRYELFAHETSHMWFGDLVTMRWFDDVWTKEVFANFMASKISSQAFTDFDHNFNFIRGNYPPAYYTDRTDGTHPIAQNLDNLDNAGLVYGNIIYNKAPIMMRMLEKRIGEERLRDGLRAYLKKFAMANSSWDELIELLDSIAPDADVKGFSEAWVKKKGMPVINVGYDAASKMLTVSQSDPTGAGTVWPQSFSVRLIGTEGSEDIDINLFEKASVTPVDTADLGTITAIIPNSHGDGYGYFKIENLEAYFDQWLTLDNDGRYGAILNLTNAWVEKDVDANSLKDFMLAILPKIDNPIIAAAAGDLLSTMAAQGEIEEEVLLTALEATSLPSVRQRLLRSVYSQCVEEPSISLVYSLWEEESEPLLNVRDYMAMAYRLAILKPEKALEILDVQRQRLADNENLSREFEFVSRACIYDTDRLLDILMSAENRRPEPWTSKMVALIFDSYRTPSNAQLKRALDILPDIQASGGIFFPTQWSRAIMGGIRTPENKQFIIDYCQNLNPESPLHRKLLEASYLTRKFAK